MSIAARWAGIVSLLGLLATAIAVPADAQRRGGGFGQPAEDWVSLGEQRVGFQVDRDTIQVGRQEGRFRAIRLNVRDNDIFLVSMRIFYRNRETQELNIRQPIRANTQTTAIPLLPGRRDGYRSIEKVDFVYRSRPGFGGQASVELQGLVAVGSERTGDGPGAAGPGRGFDGPPPRRYTDGAIERGWVLFGSQSVGFQTERDVIRIGRDLGRFGKIKFRVQRNDILLREVVVNYTRGGGTTQRYPINAEISAGGVTSALDIQDGRIESIELIYRALPSFRAGQAVVEVYGEHAERFLSGLRGDGGGHRGPPQWVLLGAQRADMLRDDRDVFHVGRRAGAFRQVKVRAQGHAVDLNYMRVTYGNGETEDVPVPRALRGGQETPPIDLRGRERFIEQIELGYRTRLNFKGEATVEVYGLH